MDVSKMCFVFGSNEGGIHGAGAARYAHINCGARYGVGYGHMTGAGAMRQSFAIPTKDREIRRTLSLMVIQNYVNGFLTYAGGRPDLEFQVTQIGCGLAGLKPHLIAPMFQIHPSNCFFDKAWAPWLEEETKFWGTM